MKRTKKLCTVCNKEFSLSVFNRHNCIDKIKEKNWFINENGKYECKICAFISDKNGIGNHVKYHFGYESPRSRKKGGTPWNKGLTKETSESIKKASKTLKKHLEDGTIIPSFKGRKHSEETRKKWKENPNMGGLREGSGRGIKGWYKSYYCDSTWELAWLVYNNEHDIKFERNKEGFEYIFEKEKHLYYPDFILEDGSYVEIKGYRNKNVEAKIEQFPKDKKLIMIEGKKEIKPYLDYCEIKYGKEFWKVLYENFKEKVKEDKELKRRNDIDNLIHQIKESNIDFNKFGWVSELSRKLGKSQRQIYCFMTKNMKEFYDTCYHNKF